MIAPPPATALSALPGRETFDFRAPDYAAVIRERVERLGRLRANPDAISSLKAYYAEHPGQFIDDWGVTSDPRNRNKGLPVEIPFVLFKRQREFIEFILERMANREPGLVEKSRDLGCSWLAMCLAATLSLFGRGVVIGVGSRKEDLVDRSGDPDSLFWKIRFFLQHLPVEFRGGWDESQHSAHLRLTFPEMGSAIIGQSGDDIGRGGRTTIFLLDEAAFLERPGLIDAALAGNTDCRIDISTPNGPSNSFAVRRNSGKIPVFTLHWRQDPRKSDEWYQRQCEILDPVTRRQEIDLDYFARVEGVLLPSEWVNAAIGAHQKLNVQVTGERRGALDVADEGRDVNCFAGRHGIVLERLQAWSGKGSDIYKTVQRAFAMCEEHGYGGLDYDADGLGAGVRGDAVAINQLRREAGKREIPVEAFRGSGSVFDPDGSLVEGRLNRDYFANLKAQSWWALRLRFQHTYRAVVEGMQFDPDQLVSIDPGLPELAQLLTELSQPTYTVNAAGKIVVDKAPDGAASPNRADAVMISFSPFRQTAYFAPASTAPTAKDATRHSSTAAPRVDAVYAVLCESNAETSVAVIYFGRNRGGGVDGSRGPGFYVLDWDLRPADHEAGDWIVRIPGRLEALAEQTASQVTCIYGDFGPWQDESLRVAGFPFEALPKDFPLAADRLPAARPFLNYRKVHLASAAHDRQVSFRGVRRNFLMEVMSLATVTEKNPLALALATGVLVGLQGAEPSFPIAAASAPAEAPSPAPYTPSVPLMAGTHVIDGQLTEIPGVPGELIHFPLPPGKHVIDDIQHIIPHGRGFRIL